MFRRIFLSSNATTGFGLHKKRNPCLISQSDRKKVKYIKQDKFVKPLSQIEVFVKFFGNFFVSAHFKICKHWVYFSVNLARFMKPCEQTI